MHLGNARIVQLDRARRTPAQERSGPDDLGPFGAEHQLYSRTEHAVTIQGMLALFLAVAHADCPASVAELEDRATRLQAPGDDFLEAYTALLADLSCLDRPATPELAGRVHRLRAIAAFVQADPEAAIAAYRGAQAADPGKGLSTEIFGPGHTLREFFEQAAARGPGATESIVAPRRTELWIDGRHGTTRPLERDALVQQLHDDTVLWTAMVDAGDPLPELVIPPRPGGGALAATTVGVAATTAGLWTGALLSRRAVARTEGPVEGEALSRVQQQQRVGNTLGYAAQAGTVLTLGLGVAVVVW